MFRTRVALVALGLAVCTMSAQAQQSKESEQPRPMERFAGEVSLIGKDGVLQRLRVTLRNWGIPNQSRIEDFPEQGLRVIELRGGEAVTTIDGAEYKRAVGDFWVVPPGAKMSLVTQNDFAALQVLSIQPAAQQ